MKSYNKYLILIFLLLGVTLWSACEKREVPPPPKPSAFSVTLDGGNQVSKEGGTRNLVIKGGSNGWWVEVSEAASSWCVITRKYGSGDVTIPINVSKNDTGAQREVEITVNATFNLPKIAFTITQE